MRYLKEHGQRLRTLGYSVLPLPFKSKRCLLTGWPNVHADEKDIEKWLGNGYASAAVGINGANTPAIDVDVLDKRVSDLVNAEIDRIFENRCVLTRTGLAPKFLTPLRFEGEPFRKQSSRVYTDGKNDHKVEILGAGEQWVAYNVHPDTDKPYSWWDGIGDSGISSVEHAALPSISLAQAREVIRAFETIGDAEVSAGRWKVKGGLKVGSSPSRSVSDFDAYIEPVGKTYDEVVALLEQLPNDDADYDDVFFPVLCAVHHELGEEGREAARGWALKSSKYVAATFDYKWDSIGKYDGKPITLRSLLKEVPQHKPAPAHPQAKEGDRVPFVEGTQFAEGFQDIEWIIEDIVPRAQVGVIYGASGSGKTFFALDMACAIQRGATWRGKHVEQCDTFYIAAEAGNGIKKRIAAYLQAKGPGAMPWFVDYQPNLATMDSVQAISESVKLRSDKPGVIFVDTMALSHDGDENSSKDMSLLLRHCKILSDNTGALVILVHHTGKDESRGMRGSSAIYAGLDFALEISAQEKDHEMVVDKLKDGERGARFGFRLPAVEVGTTPRGKVITSCYVEETDKTLEKGKKGRKPLTNHAQIFIFDVFNEALGMSESMTETELVEAVKAKQRAADNIPSQSQSIKGSINKMALSGHICKEDDRLSLPHSTHSTHSSSFE